MSAKKIRKQFICTVCGKVFTKRERGLKERVACSTSCVAKLRFKIGKEKIQKEIDNLQEHKQWQLFWNYELPRMMTRHLNELHGKNSKLPTLPKDPFELATYKRCELKFNTERFTSIHAKEYVVHYIGLSLEEKAKMGQH